MSDTYRISPHEDNRQPTERVKEGEIYCVAIIENLVDVCQVLDLSNPSMVAYFRKHASDEYGYEDGGTSVRIRGNGDPNDDIEWKPEGGAA